MDEYPIGDQFEDYLRGHDAGRDYAPHEPLLALIEMLYEHDDAGQLVRDEQGTPQARDAQGLDWDEVVRLSEQIHVRCLAAREILGRQAEG